MRVRHLAEPNSSRVETERRGFLGLARCRNAPDGIRQGWPGTDAGPSQPTDTVL